MMKKMTIMAVGAMMMLSCALIVAPTSDADDTGAGGAGTVYYGYGTSLNAAQLIEYMADDFGDDLVIPPLGQIDLEDIFDAFVSDEAEDLMEMNMIEEALKAMITEDGGTVEKCKVTTTGGAYGLHERSADGDSVSKAVSVDIAMDVKATDSSGISMTIDGLKISLDCYINTTTSKDSDGLLKSVYTSMLIGASISGKIAQDFPEGVEGTDMNEELDIPVLMFAESSVVFNTPVDLDTVKADDVCLAFTTLNMGITASLPETEEPIEFDSAVMTMTETIPFNIIRDDDEFELRIGVPLDDSDSIIDSGVWAIIPDLSYRLDVEDIPVRVTQLNDSEVDRITSGIDSVRRDAHNTMSDVNVTLTFTDKEGEILDTMNVKYGSAIPDMEYPGEIGDDLVFAYWGQLGVDEESVTKASVARGDMTLVPVFAKDLGTEFNGNDITTGLATSNVKVKVAIDSDVEIPISGVSSGKTLVVDVYNGETKVAVWTISGTHDPMTHAPSIKVGVTRGTEVPAGMDGVNPVVLNFAASGKMPSGTVVSYYVGDLYDDGASIEVFHEEADGKYSLVKRTIVSGGYIDFEAHSFSNYVLQGEHFDPNPADEKSYLNLIIVCSIAAIIAVVGVVYARR